MNYLTKAQMKTYRSRLTRAKNSGDPKRVMDTVKATFWEWDDGGYAWPDQWHTWQIALDDAINELARRRAAW